jgi:hypothetical protein
MKKYRPWVRRFERAARSGTQLKKPKNRLCDSPPWAGNSILVAPRKAGNEFARWEGGFSVDRMHYRRKWRNMLPANDLRDDGGLFPRFDSFWTAGWQRQIGVKSGISIRCQQFRLLPKPPLRPG